MKRCWGNYAPAAMRSAAATQAHAPKPRHFARAEAPAFRTLGQRYKIENLEEALAEGLINGHSDMPEFHFSASDVGDAIAYLNAIQSR